MERMLTLIAERRQNRPRSLHRSLGRRAHGATRACLPRLAALLNPPPSKPGPDYRLDYHNLHSVDYLLIRTLVPAATCGLPLRSRAKGALHVRRLRRGKGVQRLYVWRRDVAVGCVVKVWTGGVYIAFAMEMKRWIVEVVIIFYVRLPAPLSSCFVKA